MELSKAMGAHGKGSCMMIQRTCFGVWVTLDDGHPSDCVNIKLVKLIQGISQLLFLIIPSDDSTFIRC